ncbi:MAG: hypothetical protein ACUVWV_15210 [Thermodesulfobacteriota bacterium]
MKAWEYKLTRYELKNLMKEELPGPTFYCDQKGQCIIHDVSQETTDLLQGVFNEEGKKGWELVQFGYHAGELLGVWKREIIE